MTRDELAEKVSNEIVRAIHRLCDPTEFDERMSAYKPAVVEAKDAILALFNQARPVSVTGKTLDWKEWGGTMWAATTPTRTPYQITFDDQSQIYTAAMNTAGADFDVGEFTELEGAQTACQAHYNQLAASIAEVSHD